MTHTSATYKSTIASCKCSTISSLSYPLSLSPHDPCDDAGPNRAQWYTFVDTPHGGTLSNMRSMPSSSHLCAASTTRAVTMHSHRHRWPSASRLLTDHSHTRVPRHLLTSCNTPTSPCTSTASPIDLTFRRAIARLAGCVTLRPLHPLHPSPSHAPFLRTALSHDFTSTLNPSPSERCIAEHPLLTAAPIDPRWWFCAMRHV